MIFDMLITIPEYGVKIKGSCVATNTADAVESAFDEIALQWITRNPGNTIITAKQNCDVEFSIKIKSVI